MTKNTYDQGRLNLPFVGICTFGKYPYIEDWDKIEADIAVLGAPFDAGSQFRSGARMGPRGIREASTLFSFGHGGAGGSLGFADPDNKISLGFVMNQMHPGITAWKTATDVADSVYSKI